MRYFRIARATDAPPSAPYVMSSIDPEPGTRDKAGIATQNRFPAVTVQFVNTIGMVGAVLSTLCWVPQAVKVVRDRETQALSLVSTCGLAVGGIIWLIYGIARLDWPLIASNAVSLALTLVILRFKLRYG